MASNATHLRKFDGGRSTPQDYHAKWAFPPGAKCNCCPTRPSIRAIIMAPVDECQKRGMLPQDGVLNPGTMSSLVQINEGGVNTPYFRISVTYSCRQCERDFSKALAKAPSWCIVEINKGPDPTNRIVA